MEQNRSNFNKRLDQTCRVRGVAQHSHFVSLPGPDSRLLNELLSFNNYKMLTVSPYFLGVAHSICVKQRSRRELILIPHLSEEHSVFKKGLNSYLSANKHRKPVERAGGFFLSENGGGENSAWGKQAVESTLKASAAPPHPLPLHGVGGVGMFFIRRLFTRLRPLHECVSASKRERVRKRLRKAFIYRYLKAAGP